MQLEIIRTGKYIPPPRREPKPTSVISSVCFSVCLSVRLRKNYRAGFLVKLGGEQEHMKIKFLVWILITFVKNWDTVFLSCWKMCPPELYHIWCDDFFFSFCIFLCDFVYTFHAVSTILPLRNVVFNAKKSVAWSGHYQKKSAIPDCGASQMASSTSSSSRGCWISKASIVMIESH